MESGKISRQPCARTALILVLLFIASVAFSAPMNKQEAAKAVSVWLASDENPMGMELGRQVKDVLAYRNDKGEVDYYIVYLDPKGFVIVSADDLVEPIIGFAADGIFDPSQDNPLGALVNNDLHGRMAEVHGLTQAAASRAGKSIGRDKFSRAHSKWHDLIAAGDIQVTASSVSSVSDVRVAPFVQSRWNQGSECGNATYNYYVPAGPDGNANNYPCGCVATAMAQVMRFWQYPTTGIGTRSFTIYYDNTSSTRTTRGGDGNGGPYQWSNMPLDPDCSTTLAQRQAIGALCYDAGLSVNMSYSSGSSGADTFGPATAFRGTFGYSNAVKGWSGSTNTSIPTSSLYSMVNPNLDAGFPVIFGIWASGGAGHEIVADGYGYNTSTMYHHLNLGWGSYADAWYNLPSIDAGGYAFNTVSAVIYNIYTSGSGEIVSGRVLSPAGTPLAGATVTAQISKTQTYGPVTTDSHGVYAFSKVPSNKTYTISVQSPNPNYQYGSQSVTTGTSSDYGTSVGNRWAVDFLASGGIQITYFQINNGAATTSTRSVTLNSTCSVTPAYYMASEDSYFANASWVAYPISGAPYFQLSMGAGTKTVYFKVKDSAGVESAVVTDTIATDSTPPVTSANPPTGVHRTAFAVALTANESSRIYYTTNGSEPTTSSQIYANPISITKDTVLRYYGVDQIGNAESIKNQSNYYFITSDGSIASARKVANGQQVRLGGKVLYYSQGGVGYIEEPNRFSGIRVQGTVISGPISKVMVVGNLVIPISGERYIQSAAMSSDGDGSVKPVGTSNRGLLSALLDGIYVTSWGVVQPGSITSNSYVISDGSDSTGIEVITPTTPAVTPGSFVTVAGAAGFDTARVIYSIN